MYNLAASVGKRAIGCETGVMTADFGPLLDDWTRVVEAAMWKRPLCASHFRKSQKQLVEEKIEMRSREGCIFQPIV